MAGRIFQDMQEVHYCQLESQSNIYGLAKFAVSQDENKILVASLRGKVMSMAFQKTAPSSREVTFTYIPGDAEVISIDAFYRSNPVGIVVAIAFVKISEGKRTNYLNIYSECEAGGELDLDRIAQGCQSLDLGVVPYFLYHAQILHNDSNDTPMETVFLVSGDDAQVHLFREARNSHVFVEEKIEHCFPELSDLPSVVTWLHCVNVSGNKQRLTAFGCQNGFVSVSLVNLSTKSVIKTYQTEHDSPITSVQLYVLRNQVPIPEFGLCGMILLFFEVPQSLKKVEGCEDAVSLSDYHLVVTSALERAVVYANVVDRGLTDVLGLPESDAFDTVTCSLVTDIDFDGTQEIILGTYGQELLLYKFISRPSASDPSTNQSTPPADDLDDSSRSSSGTSLPPINCSLRSLSQDGEFSLVSKRILPDPVLALDAADLTGDGLSELIVLSHAGLHVFQHDLKATAELCLRRLEKLTQNKSI